MAENMRKINLLNMIWLENMILMIYKYTGTVPRDKGYKCYFGAAAKERQFIEKNGEYNILALY